MLPTLRLGFVIAPASLRTAVRTAKFVTDWHTTLPAQAALARFIDEGYLARHVRKMRLHQPRCLQVRQPPGSQPLERHAAPQGQRLLEPDPLRPATITSSSPSTATDSALRTSGAPPARITTCPASCASDPPGSGCSTVWSGG
jgi:hypothetical protein